MKAWRWRAGIARVFAAHRYRVAQTVSLERMRTTIATDLHDDIGASLSQIAILSEVARAGVSRENRLRRSPCSAWRPWPANWSIP